MKTAKLLLVVLLTSLLAATALAQNIVKIPLPSWQMNQQILDSELFTVYQHGSPAVTEFTVVDLKTKSITRTFTTPFGGSEFCFSREGELVHLSYDSRDLVSTIAARIVDPKDGRIVQTVRHPHNGLMPGTCALRPDGSFLVASGDYGNGVFPKFSTLRKGPDGKYQFTDSWTYEIGGVFSMVCASTRDVCFAGMKTYSGTGRIIVVENGKPVRSIELTIPANPDYRIALSPDDRVLYIPLGYYGTLLLDAVTYEWLPPRLLTNYYHLTFSGDPDLAYVTLYGIKACAMDIQSGRTLSCWEFNKQGNTVYEREAVSLSVFRQTDTDLICVLFHDEIRLIEVPRLPEIKAVTEAAQYGLTVATGSIINLWGRSLSPWPIQTGWENGRLPTRVNNCEVRIGGSGVKEQALSLIYVSPNQVNLQMPTQADGLPIGSTAEVWVDCNGVRSAKFAFKVNATAPALFAYPDGRPIFSYNLGGIGIDSPELKAGEIASLWANGLGATSPAVPAGMPFPGEPWAMTNSVQASLASQQLEVLYAGGAPGWAGLYQMNVRIPSSAPLGMQKLTIAVGGVTVEYTVKVTN